MQVGGEGKDDWFVHNSLEVNESLVEANLRASRRFFATEMSVACAVLSFWCVVGVCMYVYMKESREEGAFV